MSRNRFAMTKLGISVGILATVFCFSVGAQTINVMVLDQAGAQAVLRGRARNSGTRPRQSQWWILPAICLPSSGWMVSALQARILPSRRHERLRGYNGRRRRSRTTLIGAEDDVNRGDPDQSDWRSDGVGKNRGLRQG